MAEEAKDTAADGSPAPEQSAEAPDPNIPSVSPEPPPPPDQEDPKKKKSRRKKKRKHPGLPEDFFDWVEHTAKDGEAKTDDKGDSVKKSTPSPVGEVVENGAPPTTHQELIDSPPEGEPPPPPPEGESPVEQPLFNWKKHARKRRKKEERKQQKENDKAATAEDGVAPSDTPVGDDATNQQEQQQQQEGASLPMELDGDISTGQATSQQQGSGTPAEPMEVDSSEQKDDNLHPSTPEQDGPSFDWKKYAKKKRRKERKKFKKEEAAKTTGAGEQPTAAEVPAPGEGGASNDVETESPETNKEEGDKKAEDGRSMTPPVADEIPVDDGHAKEPTPSTPEAEDKANAADPLADEEEITSGSKDEASVVEQDTAGADETEAVKQETTVADSHPVADEIDGEYTEKHDNGQVQNEMDADEGKGAVEEPLSVPDDLPDGGSHSGEKVEALQEELESNVEGVDRSEGCGTGDDMARDESDEMEVEGEMTTEEMLEEEILPELQDASEGNGGEDLSGRSHDDGMEFEETLPDSSEGSGQEHDGFVSPVDDGQPGRGDPQNVFAAALPFDDFEDGEIAGEMPEEGYISPRDDSSHGSPMDDSHGSSPMDDLSYSSSRRGDSSYSSRSSHSRSSSWSSSRSDSSSWSSSRSGSSSYSSGFSSSYSSGERSPSYSSSYSSESGESASYDSSPLMSSNSEIDEDESGSEISSNDEISSGSEISSSEEYEDDSDEEASEEGLEQIDEGDEEAGEDGEEDDSEGGESSEESSEEEDLISPEEVERRQQIQEYVTHPKELERIIMAVKAKDSFFEKEENPALPVLKNVLSTCGDEERAAIIANQISPPPETRLPALSPNDLVEGIAKYCRMVKYLLKKIQPLERENVENVARLSLAAVQEHFGSESAELVSFHRGLEDALTRDYDNPAIPLVRDLLCTAGGDDPRIALLVRQIVPKLVTTKQLVKAIAKFRKVTDALEKGQRDVQESAGVSRVFIIKQFGINSSQVSTLEKGLLAAFTQKDLPGMELLKELLDADGDESRMSILQAKIPAKKSGSENAQTETTEPESSETEQSIELDDAEAGDAFSSDDLLQAIVEYSNMLRFLRMGPKSKALQNLQQVGGVCFGVLNEHFNDGSPELTRFEKGLEAAFENPYPEEEYVVPAPAPVPAEKKAEKSPPATSDKHPGLALMAELLKAGSDESRMDILKSQITTKSDNNQKRVSPDDLLHGITMHSQTLQGLGKGLQSPEMQKLQQIGGACFGVLHELFGDGSPEMTKFEQGLVTAFEGKASAAPPAGDHPGMALLQQLLAADNDDSRTKFLSSQVSSKAVTSDDILKAIDEYAERVKKSTNKADFLAQEMQSLQQAAGICFVVLHEHCGDGSPEMERFEKGLEAAFG